MNLSEEVPFQLKSPVDILVATLMAKILLRV
jgi:hypothetical protein